MLQGNVYETELWVQDRTWAVQSGMVQSPKVWMGQVRARAQELLSPRVARQQVEGWWLPAAFALGALLGLILSG